MFAGFSYGDPRNKKKLNPEDGIMSGTGSGTRHKEMPKKR